MPHDDIARDVFVAVREHYRTASLKSSNKSYTADAIAKLADAGNTAVDAPSKPGRFYRYKLSEKMGGIKGPQGQVIAEGYGASTDPSDPDAIKGGIIFKMPNPVLNCAELTQMACFVAKPKTSAYTSVHLTSADHAFCVIGRGAGFVDGISATLDKFDKQAWSDVFAVDVWLNICCPLKDYGVEAARQLGEWTKAGKRIAWVKPDEDDDSWTVPTGDYSAQFLKSGLSSGV